MSDPFDDLCKHGWLWDGPCVWCENERLRAELAAAEKECEIRRKSGDEKDKRIEDLEAEIQSMVEDAAGIDI